MKVSDLQSSFLKVAQAAAIGSYNWVGKGDRHAADDAATKAMRETFNQIKFDGTVVIGEGERDEAPMLFIGEKLGDGSGLKVDIAVDPLEGTNLAAENKAGAICVLAAGPKGSLFHAPDTYMEKIAVGPKIGRVVSLSKTIEENLDAISKKTHKQMNQITVVVLDRPRHQELIERIKKKGANVRLISDGDVFGAVMTAFEHTKADMLIGIGAAPEGVLAATALKCVGGYLEGRLKFRNDEEKQRAKKMGINDFDKIYTMDELVKTEDAIFVATGVTDGDLLKGIHKENGKYKTQSMIISGENKKPRIIDE
jgi:fructose-1,6-bisphosphatase II